MKKRVYVVREFCLTQSGDDFDLFFTFDLEDARRHLADEADRGYRLNRKSPDKVAYIIFGYNVNTDDIDEDYEFDASNAKSLYHAYSLSVCCLEHVFDECYNSERDEDEGDDD